MTSKDHDNKHVLCPRCQISMHKLYNRTYGVVGSGVYECPKCKGIINYN